MTNKGVRYVQFIVIGLTLFACDYTGDNRDQSQVSLPVYDASEITVNTIVLNNLSAIGGKNVFKNLLSTEKIIRISEANYELIGR